MRSSAAPRHHVAMPARIVCLVPSITELLCDLGLADQIVGRTGFCIHPWETVRQIPKVGGTKDVDLEKVRALEPTHAIVNVDENRREDAEALREFVPEVIVTHPVAPEDNLALYRRLGAAFGREREAEALCQAFEEALEDLTAVERPRQDVLYLIWREPWMSVCRDTYISRMLALVNWHTLPAAAEERYPTVDLAAHAGRVDRVLLSTEPFHFKPEHLPEVERLTGAPAALIDGEMTSWYGSRAIAGLRYLATFADQQLAAGRAAAG
jgi:ABC-type Fe3+-hydroxamate transport system substrate-binding protein